MSSIAGISQKNFATTVQELFPLQGCTLIRLGVGGCFGALACMGLHHMGWISTRQQTLFEQRAIIAENRNSLVMKIGVVVFSALFLASLFVNYPLEMALPVVFVAVVLIPHLISRYFYPEVSNSST